MFPGDKLITEDCPADFLERDEENEVNLWPVVKVVEPDERSVVVLDLRDELSETIVNQGTAQLSARQSPPLLQLPPAI